MRKPALPVIAALLALLASASGAGAAEAPRSVPPPVAELLTRAAKADPPEVVALIDAWKGEAHPLLLLARAQARWRLAQDAGDDAARKPLLTAAEADYRAALAGDPGLRQARLGLAQCAAARDDWSTASREAAAGIDPATADRALLGFLANAALRAGDWRLATLSAQHGIMRFPDDAALRRIELAVLMQGGRGEDARQATLALLALDPADAELWRHLAWSAQETGREDEALGALEAALAVTEDGAVRRQLASTQLARGLAQAALATVRPLVGEPPTAAALADAPLMLLASRAAADSGELALARGWLGAIPEAAQTRDLRLQSARLAVQANDGAAAGAALDALVALGERDPSVLTWAGALAEGRGDAARAEAMYQQAAGGEGNATAAASLRLAALYLGQDRRDEAATVLASHLAKRPDDAQARALLAQLQARGR